MQRHAVQDAFERPLTVAGHGVFYRVPAGVARLLCAQLSLIGIVGVVQAHVVQHRMFDLCMHVMCD